MNFRVILAAAFAAALSFACADKQASIPELEAAMNPPPGRVTVGLYKMVVTPEQGPNGISFAQQIIPVGRDGNALTNPPNTIQVAGNFSGIVTNAPGCAGVNAITAPVRITNFMIDPLRNVWADVIDMAGTTGNTSCNSTLPSQSEGFFAVSDMSQGIWKYNDLAATTDPTGNTAGGTSLPIGGVWAFRYVTTTGFQFYFAIQADDQSPQITFVDPAGPTKPLTWTSAVAANTQFEFCPVDPGFIKGSPCPAGLTTQVIAGTGVGPWSYSFAPTGLSAGATYWYRARNVYPAGTSTLVSDWIPFTYNAAPPAVTNATFLANLPATLGGLAELTWTTIPAQTDTWVVLCAGPCPATRPVGVNPAILLDQAVQWDFFPGPVSNYAVDVTLVLATDPVSGTYFDPTVAYDWRVYDYDGASPPPAFAAPHSTGTITITPVQVLPAVTSQPATFSLAAATWPVTWTADPIFTSTVVDVCFPNCAAPVDFYMAAAPITPVAGVYSLDLYTVLVSGTINPLVNTDTFELFIQNPDLVGVAGTSVAGTVVP